MNLVKSSLGAKGHAMTNLGKFIEESAYPGKTLYAENNQLYVEGVGPVSVARVRELDTVGQIQWQTEELRRLAYSLEQPPAQPARQPAQQTPPPQRSSSSSTFATIIAIVAVLAICAGAYFVITSLMEEQPAEETPVTEPAPEAPAPEPPAPEPPPSEETT
jgi:hypothetical protein